ncbi:DNA-binding response regulator [candidate division KSB1 bacterium]|nr:MAG: DNA-binding response regulator [candidate division KSB1 bacterium]
MSKGTILIVDDEEDIRDLICYNLKKENYTVSSVENGEDALKLAQQEPPDLVILDLMLPGVDGLEVCKILKANSATSAIPIVMLTAKGEEADVVAGLELGADDYITKPFSPRVLLARIKAVLRRRKQSIPAEDDILRIGELTIHPGTRTATAENQPMELTNTEFRILHYLARRPGWVFTRYQIVDAVQGENVPVTGRSVDVHVSSLRKKLGSCGSYIETVRGVGYRFKDPSHE